jgi:hypothetical protein
MLVAGRLVEVVTVVVSVWLLLVTVRTIVRMAGGAALFL